MSKRLVQKVSWLLVSLACLSVAQAQFNDVNQPLMPNADGIGQDTPAPAPKTQPPPASVPTTPLTDIIFAGGEGFSDSYVNNDQTQAHTNNALASLLNKFSKSGLSKGAQNLLKNTPVVDMVKSAYEAYQGKTGEAGHTFVKGWTGQLVTGAATAGLAAIGFTGFIPTCIAIAAGTAAKAIYDEMRENYGTGDPAKVEAFENIHKAWDMVRESGGRMTHEEALDILNAPPDETGEYAAQMEEKLRREQYNKENARDAAEASREVSRNTSRDAARPTGGAVIKPSRPACTCGGRR